jgi:hypothetical protein
MKLKAFNNRVYNQKVGGAFENEALGRALVALRFNSGARVSVKEILRTIVGSWKKSVRSSGSSRSYPMHS